MEWFVSESGFSRALERGEGEKRRGGRDGMDREERERGREREGEGSPLTS